MKYELFIKLIICRFSHINHYRNIFIFILKKFHDSIKFSFILLLLYQIVKKSKKKKKKKS